MATREIYFHDILKAFCDAGLSETFMAWIDKYDSKAPDAYRALFNLGEARGRKQLMEDIKSGKLAEEFRNAL